MEIYIDILDAVSRGNQRPTRIMFKANLSWLILQDALDYLLSSGLLEERAEKGRRVYGVTQKGLQVLMDFNRIRGELTATDLNNNQSSRNPTLVYPEL